jgi:hypothetical protein
MDSVLGSLLKSMCPSFDGENWAETGNDFGKYWGARMKEHSPVCEISTDYRDEAICER